MNQNIWGPHLWFSLHTISFTYPLKPTEEDKRNYKSFFTELQHVIPCSVCKKNYKRHLLEFPVDHHLGSRKEIAHWVIDLHNMVNSETGKRVISYEMALKKYEDVYGTKIKLSLDEKGDDHSCQGDSCHKDSLFLKISNQTIMIVTLLISLFIIVYLMTYYKIKMIRR